MSLHSFVRSVVGLVGCLCFALQLKSVKMATKLSYSGRERERKSQCLTKQNQNSIQFIVNCTHIDDTVEFVPSCKQPCPELLHSTLARVFNIFLVGLGWEGGGIILTITEICMRNDLTFKPIFTWKFIIKQLGNGIALKCNCFMLHKTH